MLTRSIAALLLFLGPVSLAFSQAAQQQIAVFKNGTGFFIHTENVSADEGFYVRELLPRAVFGTYWLEAEGNAIKSISTYEDRRKARYPISCLADLLIGLKGKRVTLQLEGRPPLSGTLTLTNRDLVILKEADGKSHALMAKDVKGVTSDTELPSAIDTAQNKRILRVDLSKKASRQPLRMMYLQYGIAWMPTYLIDIESDTKATLTLRAELMNDVEDLENAQIDLVVGVPNFQFGNLLSPLVSGQSVEDFVNILSGGSARPKLYMANARMMSQSYDAYESAGYYADDMFEPVPPQMEGSQVEDLFFYNAGNVTLKKGGRASLNVLNAPVTIKHLYDVNLPSNSSGDTYMPASQEPQKSEVWHSIELTNNTRSPLTTGAALLTVKENDRIRTLCQSMLNYTAINDKSRIRITSVPNVVVRHSESQVGRQENIKIKDRHYDLLTVEGKIELKNLHTKDLELLISRNVKGDLKQSSSDWKVKKLVSFYNSINTDNQVEWEVKMKKGEEMTITYRYQIYAYR